MKSSFLCPACNQPLQKDFAKDRPFMLWCSNPRCPSDVSNNGGSGPTEEAAYRALLLAVKHEEDREMERECEPLTEEDAKDKAAWAKAEHANDIAKSGGI